MKTKKLFITTILLLASFWLQAETKEIPFTFDDRDRLIRTEQKVESAKTEMTARFETVDRRFEAIDKRFDQLFNFLWAIIGIFTTMMISVFGFAFWDRKLSLAPLKKEDQKIISVLTEYSKTEPTLSRIMKNAGLM
jgi:hypothetical protein